MTETRELVDELRKIGGHGFPNWADEAADAITALSERCRVLEDALAQAAVPLEGITLAAHYSESNMGLCKGTWDEINNGVAHIRAALASGGRG